MAIPIETIGTGPDPARSAGPALRSCGSSVARRKRGVCPLTRKIEFFQNHNRQIPEFLKRIGAVGVARSSAQADSGRRSLTVLETNRPRPDIHPPSHFVVR